MEFQISIDIDAPCDTVWTVMSDVERWPDWTPSVRHVRRLDTPGPFRAGSRAIVRQPKLPPALWTVTDLTPGRRFVWTSGLPGWWTTGDHRVEPLTRGSRATLGIQFSGLFARFGAPLMRGLVERYVRLEADGLKRRSEELARAARRA
jgi:hypothetical protein